MADPSITGPWPGLRAFLTGSFGDLGDWSPLVELLHWLLYRVFGTAPLGYRVTSLALHAGIGVLAYRALKKRLGREDLAFAAALLWVLFPSHVEVLAQSSFKKHQLVALFGLLMLETRRSWLKVALFCSALLCRESGLLLLPLAYLDDPKNRKPLYVMAFVAVLYAVAHSVLLPRALTAPMGGSYLSHVLTAAKILGWHVFTLAVPVAQCQEHSLSTTSSLLFLLPAAALAGAGWAYLRKDAVGRFAALWTLLFLAPFLNLLPYLNFSLVANRYHYMASLGFLLLAARLWERAKIPTKALPPAAAAILLGYVAIGLPHAARYAQPLELWEHTARCAPDNPRARAGFGAELRAAGRLPEAKTELDAAVALDPAFSEPYVDLTWVNAALGKREEALAAGRRRLELRPDAVGHASLGALELSLGMVADACPHLAKSFSLAPGPEAAYTLGQCRAAAGRLDEAEMNLRLAAADLALRPRALGELADVLARAGRKADADKARAESLDLMIAALEAAPSEEARRQAAPTLADLRAKRAKLP